MNDRYDKWYKDKNIDIYLSDYVLEEDDARFIILKVLDQSIRDYITLYNAVSQKEKEDWETANLFLFENDYTIDWGEWEITPTELLDLVDVNIEWVRDQTKKKLEDKLNNG